MSTSQDTEQQKQEWLGRLDDLIHDVRQWAEELDWSTREIETTLEDHELGKHKVPALLMQKETTRMLLEPISRLAPGVDGVVDLYLLPAYDDIATLLHRENGWEVRYLEPGQLSLGNRNEAKPLPLSKDAFEKVVTKMETHGE